MRRVYITLLIALSALAISQGQTASGGKGRNSNHSSDAAGRAVLQPETKPASSSLTIDEVLTMIAAKLPEEIIAMKVRQSGIPLEISTAQLIALKNAGASASLLTVLMDPKRTYEAPKLDSTPVAGPQAVPSTVSTSGAPALEMGVYLKKQGQWTELSPEVVNWKTGGTIKSLASAGVVKKDLNGNIDGPSSKTSVKTPVEILLVTAEGVNATEYQLIRLRVNQDYREFRSVTGGILNQRSGAMRDLIPFESKKVAPRQFEFVVPPSLGAGQYGVLPPGVGGSSSTSAVTSSYGKMYTFHIVE